MTTRKITLAFITLLSVAVLQACNGSHDKTGMETETGQPAAHENASGSDTSHTTSRLDETVSGVEAKPGDVNGAKDGAKGTTTGQGTVGADSVYQKNTQKSKQ